MRYVVELYLPKRAHSGFSRALARAARAAGEVPSEPPVRCLGMVLLPLDETCFLRYEAGSSDAVEEAARRAGIEFERVVEAQELDAGHQAASQGQSPGESPFRPGRAGPSVAPSSTRSLPGGAQWLV